MLKKLTIKNFKAIQNMTIEFTPMTVLIGENSCGKSTVLQAIDFMCATVSRDIPEYLRENNYPFEILKSQCFKSKDHPIEFISTWEIIIDKNPVLLEWKLSIDCDRRWIIKEKLVNCSTNTTIFTYHFNGESDFPEILGQMNIQSSVLKYINSSPSDKGEIENFMAFLTNSINYEVLSPDKMRIGRKMSYPLSVGTGGEALAFCIYEMHPSDRQQLDKIISDIIGCQIAVKIQHLRDKFEIQAVFGTGDDVMYIDSAHISDGLLRIITFAVITHDSLNKSMILLDEIENGINPYKTEQIISLFRAILDKNQRQIIVTTHSPVMLNDFQPEEIVYLWKDVNNYVHARRFFDTEEMREFLDFLNPGEIWENFGKEVILEKLNVKPENK